MHGDDLYEILEALPIGILLAREDGKVYFANNAALECMRTTREDIEGMNVQVFLPFSAEKKDFALKTEKGEVPVRPSLTQLASGEWMLSMYEISELHDLQNELLKMDRLASVGELTSGIAHEIRNPLAGIKTTAQALNEELPVFDHRRTYVTRIINEINRLNKLLLNFFDFAKPKALNVKACNVKNIITDAIYMVKETARQRHVQILEFYPTDKVSISADPDSIQQVLMNIMLNAIQAVGEGGRVEVVLTDRVSKVEIAITDSGPGIPEEIRKRIFDPFFTTKAKGVGLGLSISYRIVKMHSGNILISSSKKGATFTVILPREPKKR